MRNYTLNVTFAGSEEEKYSVEEILRDYKKRSHVLGVYEKIEDLDNATSIFSSFENMNEALNEVHNKNEKLSRPFIIVDESSDLSKSKARFDIVYKDDFGEIKNADNIKTWTIEYLMKNPSDIERFSGIRTIYANSYRGKMLTEDLIGEIVNAYVSADEYMHIRNTYFTLKKLDSREKKNAVHK